MQQPDGVSPVTKWLKWTRQFLFLSEQEPLKRLETHCSDDAPDCQEGAKTVLAVLQVVSSAPATAPRSRQAPGTRAGVYRRVTQHDQAACWSNDRSAQVHHAEQKREQCLYLH